MKELLKKYKNGTLTVPDEQDAFLHELLQIRAERMQLKGSTMVAQKPPKEAIIRSLNVSLQRIEPRKYFAAAACILLACFAFWRISTTEKNTENGLMAADITSISEDLESVSSRTRGNSTFENDAQTRIFDLYEKGNHKGVIQELEGKETADEIEYLYLGLAYLNSEKREFQKALDCFKKIETANSAQSITMAKALCHIGLKQNGEARKILEHIKANKNYGNEYCKLASRLLEGLK